MVLMANVVVPNTSRSSRVHTTSSTRLPAPDRKKQTPSARGSASAREWRVCSGIAGVYAMPVRARRGLVVLSTSPLHAAGSRGGECLLAQVLEVLGEIQDERLAIFRRAAHRVG